MKMWWTYHVDFGYNLVASYICRYFSLCNQPESFWAIVTLGYSVWYLENIASLMFLTLLVCRVKAWSHRDIWYMTTLGLGIWNWGHLLLFLAMRMICFRMGAFYDGRKSGIVIFDLEKIGLLMKAVFPGHMMWQSMIAFITSVTVM